MGKKEKEMCEKCGKEIRGKGHRMADKRYCCNACFGSSKKKPAYCEFC